MHPDRRVWVLPASLAALIVWMPVQALIESELAEPYPGLFQPPFWGASQNDDRTVKYPFVKLSVDGRRVRPADVLTRDDRRDALEQMFPPRGGVARADSATRRLMRMNLVRLSGHDPRELVVRWQERRYHLDTGTITRHQTTATYRVDLRRNSL